jgi:hypothetical protein
MARVDHDELACHRRPAMVQPFVLAQLVGPATDHSAGELAQGSKRRRSASAVGRQANVALELAQGVLGSGAEHAIGATAVETHVDQPVLKTSHVIAHVWVPDRERQRAVAKPPPRLVEGAVRLAIDDSIDSQTPLLLEASNGSVARLIEHVQPIGPVAHVVGGKQAELAEPMPKFEHSKTAVAVKQGLVDALVLLLHGRPRGSGTLSTPGYGNGFTRDYSGFSRCRCRAPGVARAMVAA